MPLLNPSEGTVPTPTMLTWFVSSTSATMTQIFVVPMSSPARILPDAMLAPAFPL
jgi:hypothetical protein